MDYYLDVHGLLVGIKLAPCNETGQIESFSVKNPTEQARIRGDGLFFSAFLSRAVLDFCALPPPMFDEEEGRDRRAEQRRTLTCRVDDPDRPNPRAGKAGGLFLSSFRWALTHVDRTTTDNWFGKDLITRLPVSSAPSLYMSSRVIHVLPPRRLSQGTVGRC
jgi:hypothetical protein